jgi:hypothetical protein
MVASLGRLLQVINEEWTGVILQIGEMVRGKDEAHLGDGVVNGGMR